MKRILTIILLTVFLIAGCETVPEEIVMDTEVGAPDANFVPNNSVFGVAHVDDVSGDPYSTANKLNAELAGLMCESLFSIGKDFSVTPVLCSEYYYNGAVYTFRLKSGVTFSDGSPLTAADVEYSLNAARAQGSYYATRLSSISNVRAMRDGTVNITLSHENSRFPALLDIPIIKKGTRESPLPVGTGMYAPTEDGKTLIARSKHHSGKEPLYSSIEIINIRSTDELIFEFESGNISILTSDPTGISTLSAEGVHQTHNVPTTIMHYIGFNCADAVLSDPSIRQRIARAIDRDALASQDFALMGNAASMPVHPNSVAYPKKASEVLSYDSTTAISVSKPLTILVNSESSAKLAVCKRIAESLTSLGATTTVRALPFNEYVSALSRGDFTLYYAEVSLGADFDITRLIAGPLNYGKFYNQELLALNSDQLRAGEAEADFYAKFAELCPFSPIMFKDTALTTQKNFFSEIHATSQNIYNDFSAWKLGG